MSVTSAASRCARVARVQTSTWANRIARRLPERDRVTSYMGYRFSYPSRSEIGRAVSKGVVWDRPLQALVGGLRAGDVVCDVGSNLGASLLTMCQQRPDLTFVCFEGSPRFMPYLTRNVTENGLERRVEVHHALIGPDSTRWTLSSDVTSGSVALENRLRRRLLFQERLESTSLDRWFAARVPPALLKIDTDGFEYQVLSSAATLLGRRRPSMFIEYCPSLLSEVGDSAEELMTLLTDAGYSEADVYSPTGTLLKAAVPLHDVDLGRYPYVDLAIPGDPGNP